MTAVTDRVDLPPLIEATALALKNLDCTPAIPPFSIVESSVISASLNL